VLTPLLLTLHLPTLDPYQYPHTCILKLYRTTYNNFNHYSWLFKQCTATGSVADPGCFIPDPGSGSLTFLSRIRIPDPGSEKAPDPRSWILLYIKIGMKNKTNFCLAFIVSGASFISQKLKNKDS
jgi:hypothetical protein